VYVIGLSATDWLYFDSGVLAKIWRDGEAILFTGIIDPSEGRKSRLGTVGCVVSLAGLVL